MTSSQRHPIRQRTLLLLSTAAIVLVWQLPYGRLLLYPLSLLATFAHEMGHGLTAQLLGAQFDELMLYADGSGMAVWHGNLGRVATALVAAGGLLGPTLAGVSLLLLSRQARFARAVLVLLAMLIAVSVILWTRNAFGALFLLVLATLLALAAKALSETAAAFLLHLMAITLCLSCFTDLGYMFSNQALVVGVAHLSDSAVISHTLGLPYWFWGAALALLSLTFTLLGIVFVSRKAV
jgi:hypothetical protein